MSLLRSRIIPLSIVTLSLIGCGTIETNMPVENQAEVSVIERSDAPTDNPVEYAIWQAEQQPTEALAAPFYLHAAKLKAVAQSYSQAQQLLEDHVINVDFNDRFDGLLLYSRVSAAQNSPLLAIQALSQARELPVAELPQNRINLLTTHAEVMTTLEIWPSVVRNRVKLSTILPPTAQPENEMLLWSAVQNLTDNELSYLKTTNLPLLPGWLEISRILRNQDLNVDQQLQQFNRWQVNNPSHPASINPPADFKIMASLDDQLPNAFAILLPMSKELQTASSAILDGMLRQYYTNTGKRPRIDIIDTDQYEDFSEAYQTALDTEAEIIIGPLRKQNVARLPSLVTDIPTIALNQLDTMQAHQNLYHFSLNVDDDIRELMSFAKQEGAVTSAILAIQHTWALRQSDQFQRLAEDSDTPVLESLSYEDTPLGRQRAIKSLLQIDESEARISSVAQWTGQSIETTSRARQDLDYVYYVGKMDNAKQIRPLIDFYFANDIPMLASQTLHDGKPSSSTKNEDIERIIFTEVPALSQQPSKTNSPYVLQRLNALGNDSYLIASRLPLFTLVRSAKLSAKTGIITLNEEGIFNRRPNILTYKKGALVDAKQEYRESEAY